MNSTLKNVIFMPIGKSRPNRVGKYTSKNIYSDFVLSSIRRKVHQFYRRNEPPTVTKLLKDVNDDENLPNFHISTLTRILKDIGFVYIKRQRKSILIDRDDIQLWRHRYLWRIKEFRAQGRNVRRP